MTTVPYTNSVPLSTLSPGDAFTLPADQSTICQVLASNGFYTPPSGEILNSILSSGVWGSTPGTTQVIPLPNYQVGPV